MWFKRLQLGLIHTAVAITLVPFGSTLNRVMILEMGIAATIVTLLVALPYVFSPIQVAIGSYADRHPILGLRRTPYIAVGLLMCVGGAFLAPHVVGMIGTQGWTATTLVLSIIAFGAWGMGYNFASVSYLSLASEIDEQGRARTIAIMFFMMVIGIIISAATVGHIVEVYSQAALQRAFWTVGVAALAMGVIGLIAIEPRSAKRASERRYSFSEIFSAVTDNPQGRLFFLYLVILLAALLGQDVLLEPFAGQALSMSVAATTRITSIWGTCMLLAFLIAGWLQGRLSTRAIARIGAWGALIGFVAIGITGLVPSKSLFYTGITVLGFGTGLSTVSNLSLMLDMTIPENVGLFIGAWGMANAISRLIGQLLSGVVRDALTGITGSGVTGYTVVFLLEALFLFISLFMLRRIDVDAFQQGSTAKLETLIDRAALVGEAGSD